MDKPRFIWLPRMAFHESCRLEGWAIFICNSESQNMHLIWWIYRLFFRRDSEWIWRLAILKVKAVHNTECPCLSASKLTLWWIFRKIKVELCDGNNLLFFRTDSSALFCDLSLWHDEGYKCLLLIFNMGRWWQSTFTSGRQTNVLAVSYNCWSLST